VKVKNTSEVARTTVALCGSAIRYATTGGPDIAATPFITPEITPTTPIILFAGRAGSRTPRPSSTTEQRISTPMVKRAWFGDSRVNSNRPSGVPATIPGDNHSIERQSVIREAARKSITLANTCSTTVSGTTRAGGNARLSNGTAAIAKPKPVYPRSSAARRALTSTNRRATSMRAAPCGA
jgi:hypothetical protein